MKWTAHLISRYNRRYTSECGRYTIHAPSYRGGWYALYVDDKCDGYFSILRVAKASAEYLSNHQPGASTCPS